MKKEIREPNPNEEIIHDDEAYLLSEEKQMLNEELQNDENNIVATGNRELYEMLDEKLMTLGAKVKRVRDLEQEPSGDN